MFVIIQVYSYIQLFMYVQFSYFHWKSSVYMNY
jgi:hypothetical protein